MLRFQHFKKAKFWIFFFTISILPPTYKNIRKLKSCSPIGLSISHITLCKCEFPPLPLTWFSTLAIHISMHNGQTRMPLKLLQLKVFQTERIPPPSRRLSPNLSHPCNGLPPAACLVVLQPLNGKKIIYASTTLRFSASHRTIRSSRFSQCRSFQSAPPRIRANQPWCLDFRNPSLFAYKSIEVLPQWSNSRRRCIMGRSNFGLHGKLGGLPPAVHARPNGRRLLQPRVQLPDHIPRCATNLFFSPILFLGYLFFCYTFCWFVALSVILDEFHFSPFGLVIMLDFIKKKCRRVVGPYKLLDSVNVEHENNATS